jgi:hypothetical protein
LGLSLLVPLYFGLISLHHAFSQPYIIQDDARQHVAWFQQFVDPQLFAHDLIADYFETMAPLGYKAVYWGMAQVGVEPLVLAKLLPTGLAILTTIYIFHVSVLLFPIPFAGFLSTLILNQHLWLNEDLISATPRAFLYPIFAAFLYYLLGRSLAPCLLTVALQGLFFPAVMLIQVSVLMIRMGRWHQGRLRWSTQSQDYGFALSGLVVAALVILPFALNLSEFGAAIQVEQMQEMPEYGLQGRNEHFGVHGLDFLLNGSSGIRIPVFPSIILVGFGLPVLCASRFPLAAVITDQIKILGQVLLGSLVLYGLAHMLLLRLHFPSRYMYHSWRFVLAIASGIVLTILLHAGWCRLQRHCQQTGQWRRQDRVMVGLTGLIAAIVIVVPAIPWLFLQFQGWVIGSKSDLYQYLAQQPADIVVASLSLEANNLPAFAQRSTLVSREFSIPHHPNYYDQIQQRTVDIIHAQYDQSLEPALQAIEHYGIDFFLIDTGAFDSRYLNQDWLMHSSFQVVVKQAQTHLKQGLTPAIAPLIQPCSVLTADTYNLVNAVCVKQMILDHELQNSSA